MNRMACILADRRCAFGLLLVALVQAGVATLNADVTWLITVVEEITRGAVPYVDMIETNPPAAFLIYWPQVRAAQDLGVTPEALVSASVFVFAGISLGLGSLVLRYASWIDAPLRGALLNAALFTLVLMPGFSFAEREHIAALSVLPFICQLAVEARGQSLPLILRIGCAMLAALAVIIKPHFGAALALPLIWLAWKLRSPTVLWRWDRWLIAGMALAYVGFVLWAYPDFVQIVPLLFETYVALYSPLREVFAAPWFIEHCVLVVIFGITCACWRVPLIAQLLMAASLGFLLAYAVQLKGWVNHGLPGVALALCACALGLFARLRLLPEGDAIGQRLIMFVVTPGLFYSVILFGATLPWTGHELYPGLTKMVREAMPPSARMMALTGQLDIGHPLVRQVGGRWVGRSHSTWSAHFALALLEQGRGSPERLRHYIELDLEGFVLDVRKHQPQILLSDDDPDTLRIMSRPVMAALFARYQRIGEASGVTVWRLKG